MRKNLAKKVIILGGLLLAPAVWAAESLDYLNKFVENLSTLEADFSQKLVDANGRQLQQQTGVVAMKKPGRFNWHYLQPFEQQIVADGEKLWFYDVDLEQVTVKPLEEALGSAPIALLTSERPLNDQFVITELGKIGELYMLQLEAKVKDTDYGFALLAFNEEGLLEVMELKDPLGQVTTIELENIKFNQDIDAQRFEFKVPEGVDVIGMQ